MSALTMRATSRAYYNPIPALRDLVVNFDDKANHRELAELMGRHHKRAYLFTVAPNGTWPTPRKNWRHDLATFAELLDFVPTLSNPATLPYAPTLTNALRRYTVGDYRPFDRLGLCYVGPLVAVCGESDIPFDVALDWVCEQGDFAPLPVTLSPVPGVANKTRVWVWLWPEGNGPEYWHPKHSARAT